MRNFLAVTATATLGLLTGLFSMDMIAVRSAPVPAPAAAPIPRPLAVRPAPPRPETRAAPQPEPTEQERWIVSEAQKLAEHFRESEGDASILLPFDGDYTSDAEFVVDSKGSSRWITLTAARVSCEAVDRYLANHSEDDLGPPDQCARWQEQARKVLGRHGVRGQAAQRFLRDAEDEPDVRVLLVYAGWTAAPGNPQRIEMTAAAAAPVYPQRDFARRRREALDQVYRSMSLGPYAKE